VPALPNGDFAGTGRNAMCIAGDAGRAGFIVFGEGHHNCSARGRVEAAGATWQLVPDGEVECRIPLEVKGEQIGLGAADPSCGYYCGTGVDFRGEPFKPIGISSPVTDLAGDPLC